MIDAFSSPGKGVREVEEWRIKDMGDKRERVWYVSWRCGGGNLTLAMGGGLGVRG